MRTYDSLVSLHGWEDQVVAIRAAFRSSRPDTIAEHVTDEMLWSIAICGDSAQAQQMLRLVEALEEHDDVQHVYANFDIDESEIQAAVGAN